MTSDRFPPDVSDALSAAGWHPGRDVAASVDEWARRHGIVDDLHPAARAALAEFGGLHLPQRGPGGAPGGGFASHLYPAEKAPDVGEFAAVIGRPVAPIGWHDDGPSHLVVDVDGRVFLLHWADDLLVAETVDAAIGWMIRGGDLRPVDDAGATA